MHLLNYGKGVPIWDSTWLYKLIAKDGLAEGSLVRKFGVWSGKKEIEAIAKDNELGHIYFSDEQSAVKKYPADPKKGNKEIAQFAKENFAEDIEGISIHKTGKASGYLLLSDHVRKINK